MALTGELEPVEEIYVGSGGDDGDKGSGSGMQEMILATNATPPADRDRSGANIRDFFNTSDSLGRLYAYRYSNTSVVLGTRSANIDTSEELYMAIGLSEDGNGEYVCEAENFPERERSGISRYTVNIQAEQCEHLASTCVYLYYVGYKLSVCSP